MRLSSPRSLLLLAIFATVTASCRDARLRSARGTIRVTPISVDFGTTAPARPIAQTITLANWGIVPLHLDSFPIDGANAALFSVASPDSATLASGAQVTVILKYSPVAIGNHHARLLIRSDASNTQALAIELTGNAAIDDPCANITCDKPLRDCLNPLGTCKAAGCIYASKDNGTACDDGDLCTENDACTAGFCHGTPKSCLTPPDATCADTSSLTSSSSPGSCNAGVCSYPQTTLRCKEGCTGDVCSPDPCLGVVCNQPKPCFQGSGKCVNGTCQYQPDEGALCNSGNSCDENPRCDASGGCVGTPKSCTTQPPPICADTKTLTTFDAAGSCAIGTCHYVSHNTVCSPATPVCLDGVCIPLAPVQIKSVFAAAAHTCAVTTGGGLKCWWYNTAGGLGDNTKIDRHSPVDVVGLSVGVSAVSAGTRTTCAVTTGGGLKCWGSTLGNDPSLQNHLSPFDIPELTSNVSAVSLRSAQACALTGSGGLKCWGYNFFGVLGDGTTTDRKSPVDVPGLTAGVSAVSLGYYHTCALTTSGGVKCWGNITRPVTRSPVDWGLTSGVSAISANGDGDACAVTTGGGLKCWGFGIAGSGQNPFDIVGLTSGVSAVSVSSGGGCAVTTSGGVKCWGDNRVGQLGDNTTTDHTIPVDVLGLTSGVTAVSTGDHHACAVTITGGLKCWGDNSRGQLGDNTTTERHTPVDVKF